MDGFDRVRLHGEIICLEFVSNMASAFDIQISVRDPINWLWLVPEPHYFCSSEKLGTLPLVLRVLFRLLF